MVYYTYQPQCAEQLRKEAHPVKCAETAGLPVGCKQSVEGQPGGHQRNRRLRVKRASSYGNKGFKQEDSLSTMH